MKRIWYALIIAVGIGAICIYQYNIINRTTIQMEKNIDIIVEAVDEGDFEKSEEYRKIISSEWEESVKIINCFINHDITDKIHEKLYTLNALAANKNSEELKINAGRLKLALHILRDGEKVRIENLL